MKYFAWIYLGASLLLGITSLARADVITDWNQQAVNAGYAAQVTPGVSARNIAMVHIAIFEAVNSIEPRYTPYRKRFSVDPNASHEAAAAAAAHNVLVRAYPEQTKEFDKTLEATLAAVPDGPPKTEGRGSANRRHARYLTNVGAMARTPPTAIAHLPLRGNTFPPIFQ
jgi:hypothetical protein